MLKKWKKLLCVIMIVVLGVGTMQYIELTPTVQAISAKQKQKKKKVLKAYKKFLSTDSFMWGSTKVSGSDVSFALKDLDGDKIPELIASCFTCAADGYERVYTYKNGKVKELLVADHGDFNYYPKQHIIKFEFAQSGLFGTIYYKISRGATKEVARRDGVYETEQNSIVYKYFFINGKDTTKAKYNKKIKKLKLKGKYKPKERKATKKNLKKYLK